MKEITEEYFCDICNHFIADKVYNIKMYLCGEEENTLDLCEDCMIKLNRCIKKWSSKKLIDYSELF